MSNWTHILGVIRFESMNANVWPEPPNKTKVLAEEAELVHVMFHAVELPHGSEGPLSVETILTSRGPTVVLTGDLRDFGKEDLPSIVKWVNERKDTIKDLFVRDGFIRCEIEYGSDTFIIDDSKDDDFELRKL